MLKQELSADLKLTRLYYRADKRPFMPGDPIRTAGDFSDSHPPALKLAEKLLASTKSDAKPSRADCLMLFENEECAREYCAKLIAGRLYKVRISPEAILHRGDMHIVDTIGLKLSKHEDASADAKAYWSGQENDLPCIEVLVAAGIVEEELEFTSAERKQRIRRVYGVTSSPATDEDLDAIIFDRS